MSVTTEVIKQPNAPMADVNIKMPSGKTRYFKLPAQNADSFAIEYKKQDKNRSTVSNIAFGFSIFAGVILAKAFTKNITDKTMQFLIGAVGGILGASGSSILCDKFLDSQQNSMIKKYGAQETYFEA